MFFLFNFLRNSRCGGKKQNKKSGCAILCAFAVYVRTVLFLSLWILRFAFVCSDDDCVWGAGGGAVNSMVFASVKLQYHDAIDVLFTM